LFRFSEKLVLIAFSLCQEHENGFGVTVAIGLQHGASEVGTMSLAAWASQEEVSVVSPAAVNTQQFSLPHTLLVPDT
jgi:hypothetical protein